MSKRNEPTEPTVLSSDEPVENQVPVPESMPVRNGKSLSRDGYFAVEEAGKGLFASTDLSLPEKVFGLYLVVAEAGLGAAMPRPLEELIPLIRAGSDARDETKARLVRSLLVASLAQWGGPAQPQGGVGLMMSLLIGIAKQVGGFGSIFFARWQSRISVSAVQAVQMTEIQPAADKAFEGFFRAQLSSGWLLRYGSLFRGASLMLLGLSIGQWLIRASAVAAARNRPTDEDIKRAIETIRCEMVETGPGFKLVLEGVFSQFFDALLDRPSVASSIAFSGR